MSKKLSDYVVSPLIQKIFITLGLVGYAAELATTLPSFFSYYDISLRFSQYTYAVAEGVLLPILLFLIAYASVSKKTPLLWRVFQGVLLAVIGRIVQVIVLQLMQIPIDELLFKMGAGFDTFVWFQIASTVLVVGSYSFIIRYYRRNKIATNKISSSLQRVLVIAVCGAATALIGLTLYRILRQYPTNPNLSGFYVGMISTIALPAVLVVTSYVLNGKLKGFARVFACLLWAVMGMMIYDIMTNVATLIRPAFSGQSSYEAWFIYELAIAAIAFIAYVMMMWFVGRQPQKTK